MAKLWRKLKWLVFFLGHGVEAVLQRIDCTWSGRLEPLYKLSTYYFYQLQSNHLSVIRGLNFFSIHDGGGHSPMSPSGYAPEDGDCNSVKLAVEDYVKRGNRLLVRYRTVFRQLYHTVRQTCHAQPCRLHRQRRASICWRSDALVNPRSSLRKHTSCR